MKAKLTLSNPLWQTPERRAILDKVVQQSAAELESKIKQKILASRPAGRTYRRGAAVLKGGKPAAFSLHRASKKGQPPAVDSGGLVNSIGAKKTGAVKAAVSSGKNYAGRLDRKDRLDRPFFASTAEEFRAKFRQNLAEAIRGVKTT
jgi:hypothetical protein